jgi:hypothetical protein
MSHLSFGRRRPHPIEDSAWKTICAFPFLTGASLSLLTLVAIVSGLEGGSVVVLEVAKLARMYRYRSLVAEAINDQETTASLRQDMVKAHNLASLRRDVDCQATLLNLLLRDLLLHSQSKLVVFIICQVGIAHTSQSNFCPLHPPP